METTSKPIYYLTPLPSMMNHPPAAQTEPLISCSLHMYVPPNQQEGIVSS